jgi:hypothetical protein
VANIENACKVAGKLRFLNQEIGIELQPGEIKVIKRDEKTPVSNTTDMIISLPEVFHVEWEKMNMLPLSRWQNENGEVCHFSQSDNTIIFEWGNKSNIKTLEWLIPIEMWNNEVFFYVDGERLKHSTETNLFADKYLKFELKDAQNIGHHSLRITGMQKRFSSRRTNMYLAGDFSVDIKTIGDFKCFYREYYNMKMFLPEYAEIYLDKGKDILYIGSWAEQGYPFYSGFVKYSCEFSTTEHIGSAILVLPQIESVCSVKLNGKELGKAIWAPYEFKLPALSNKCHLEITVWNTMANLLEEYKAKSGIIERPFIKWNKDK